MYIFEPIDQGSRLQPYWREWCAMGKFLSEDRGLTYGLEYLIGYKFLDFIIRADPSEEIDFAREIRSVFTTEQIRPYFKILLRTREARRLALVHKAWQLLLGP